MINTSKLNVGNIAQDHLSDNVKIKNLPSFTYLDLYEGMEVCKN